MFIFGYQKIFQMRLDVFGLIVRNYLRKKNNIQKRQKIDDVRVELDVRSISLSTDRLV